MPATNKGDVQDALRAVSLHLAKGLGIAPRPGISESKADVALTTAQTLVATAVTAAANLPNLHRSNAQSVSVVTAVTAVLV